MERLHEVLISPQPIDRFARLLGQDSVRAAKQAAAAVRERLRKNVLWNLNSTERGGGVAEMLRSLLGYARGEGIDVRWLVIGGTPDFFHITKRLHHALHGSTGDGSPLGQRERSIYEAVLNANARELQALVRRGDVVLLHDPQTAGIVPSLAKKGVGVIWRCHVGHEEISEETERGWAFLAPYLEKVDVTIFSRDAYIPQCCDHGRSIVIPPSIDAFSAKNQEMDEDSVHATLVHTGLVEGGTVNGSPTFLREDGSPGRVDRCADVIRLGRAPSWDTPLVVQVSRWDPLKDHVGVMRGFVEFLERFDPDGVQLVLAGPNVHAVADDPEAAAVFSNLLGAWWELPHSERRRVHLAALPMTDVEENAAIVNALQRHATVVVQKSLQEGFGLTVTEAMWKARPLVASAVGGIRDQVEDGVHGLLLQDPSDLGTFATALHRLIGDRSYAARLGEAARGRVRERYLGVRHLLQYAGLLERLAPKRRAPRAASHMRQAGRYEDTTHGR